MAKYCTNCGKKLKEGESCDCVKPIIDDKTKQKFFDVFSGMFKAPIDTMKEFGKKSNFSISVALIAILSVLAGFFVLSIVKNGYSLYHEGLYSSFRQAYEIPYLKIFFTSIVLVFVLSFLYNGILYIVNKYFFKRECDFKEVYSLYGANSIIMSVTFAASAIMMFVNGVIGLVILSLGSILSVVYNYHSIKFMGNKDENKYGYIYLTVNGLFYLAIYILSVIFM